MRKNNDAAIRDAANQTLKIMGKSGILNEEDACVFLYFLSNVLFENILQHKEIKYLLSEMLKDDIDVFVEKSQYTS